MRKVIIAISLCIPFTVSAQGSGLWGMTKEGGQDNLGTIFRIDLDGSDFQVVHSFDSISGSQPEGGLCLAPDGMLYGLTNEDGENDRGTIFRISPTTAIFEKLVDLDVGLGAFPWSSFIVGNDGLLYGSGVGELIRFNTNTLVVETFGDEYVNEMMVQGSDGWIYGANTSGGASFIGSIFRLDPATLVTEELYSFGGPDAGERPYGRLCQAPNGKFYGMTHDGGLYDDGLVYEYDVLTDNFALLALLNGDWNGAKPWSGFIVLGPDKLLAPTALGGSNSLGALLELQPSTGQVSLAHSFVGATEGSLLFGGLVLAADGFVYGMTSLGGSFGKGTIYRYDHVAQQVNVLHHFEGGANGESARAELVVVDGSVGLSNLAVTELSVAPNPAEDHVVVRFGTDAWKGSSFTLLDMTGRMVWQGRCTGPVQRIALPQIAGMYQLRCDGDFGSALRSVVVQ